LSLSYAFVQVDKCPKCNQANKWSLQESEYERATGSLSEEPKPKSKFQASTPSLETQFHVSLTTIPSMHYLKQLPKRLQLLLIAVRKLNLLPLPIQSIALVDPFPLVKITPRTRPTPSFKNVVPI
jgi:hypothetical protein